MIAELVYGVVRAIWKAVVVIVVTLALLFAVGLVIEAVAEPKKDEVTTVDER